MSGDKSFAVIGIGLLGGSIAKAIKKTMPNAKIIGVTTNKNLVSDSAAKQIFSLITPDINEVKVADIIIIATPVRTIISNIARLKDIAKPGAVITDVGSVKRTIMNAATILPDNIHFVGGHPMAGSHNSGFAFADENLFNGAAWVICPSGNADADETIINLIKKVGADPIIIDPELHDKYVAETSHLPHIIAAVLAGCTLAGDEGNRPFLATGFLDTTRIAASDPVMWEEIINNNTDNIIKSISRFQKELTKWQKTIKERDVPQLTALLAASKQHRESVNKNRGEK